MKIELMYKLYETKALGNLNSPHSYTITSSAEFVSIYLRNQNTVPTLHTNF